MEFFKGLQPLASWLLRLALALIIILIYQEAVSNVNFQSPLFFLAVLSYLGAILLLLGGFLQNTLLTRIGALLLVLLGMYGIVSSFQGVDLQFSSKLIRVAIAFYFLTAGNKA